MLLVSQTGEILLCCDIVPDADVCQKRKCDKRFPTCSLCLRIGRACDYTAETHSGTPSQEEFAALREQVSNLEQLLRSTNSSTGSILTNGSSSGDASIGVLSGSNGTTPAHVYSPNHASSWPGPSSFPPLFFLDSNAFEYERFQIQAPYVKVPPGALTALGSSAELRAMIEQYVFRRVAPFS